MANRVAGPEIEKLIQLLAKLPGLGPRSARRVALHLIKKKDQLLVPLAEAATHPHNRARESFVTVGGIEMPAPAPRFSHTPPDTLTTGDAGSVEMNEILQHWRTAT